MNGGASFCTTRLDRSLPGAKAWARLFCGPDWPVSVPSRVFRSMMDDIKEESGRWIGRILCLLNTVGDNSITGADTIGVNR